MDGHDFGVDYPTQITADIVLQMVGALVKRDNVKGLSEKFVIEVQADRIMVKGGCRIR